MVAVAASQRGETPFPRRQGIGIVLSTKTGVPATPSVNRYRSPDGVAGVGAGRGQEGKRRASNATLRSRGWRREATQLGNESGLYLDSGDGIAPSTPVILRIPDSVAQYGTWEASLTAAAGVNPFDPGEVQVACQFQSPSGRAIMALGFYYQGYRRSLDAGGRERLQAEGAPEWRVRFAPSEPGVWTYRLAVAHRGGNAPAPSSGSFTVTASSGGGWIKVDPTASHRFTIVREGRENVPFIPVGENMCWSEAGGTYDYDRWLPALATAGGNCVRLWVNEFPSSFGVEGGGGAVGDYRGRMDRAWMLDYVLDLVQDGAIA